MTGAQELRLYGVLRDYDFVNFVEADDNEMIARVSIDLGVKEAADVIALPAIPIRRLEAMYPDRSQKSARR